MKRKSFIKQLVTKGCYLKRHGRYSRMINFREGWKGHLWQGRFASYVMDEKYLLACARYIELNPLRARLVDNPVKWPWSSAKGHVQGIKDRAIGGHHTYLLTMLS